MEENDQIQQEVDKTMRALDGIERAEADPQFYGRLKRRLQAENYPTRPIPIRSILVAAAAVVLLIIVNLFTVLRYEQAFGDTNTAGTEELREENLEAFAREYELQLPTFYSYQPNGEEQP